MFLLFRKESGSNLKGCYLNIKDMPVYNWFEFQDTNNPKYLDMSGLARDGVDYVSAWESVLDSYIQKFGVSEELIDRMNTEKRLLRAWSKYYKTGDRFILNEVNRLKMQLETLNKGKKESSDYMSLISAVEDYKKRQLDERSLSTYKFYIYLKDMDDYYNKLQLRNGNS